MACVRYVVSGRVQGVFYRASAQEAAINLGLVGWVRNQANGTVEVLACGSESRLRQLEHWLWDGPKFSEVKNIDVASDKTSEESFKDFTVRY